jgi:hypothetical protein
MCPYGCPITQFGRTPSVLVYYWSAGSLSRWLEIDSWAVVCIRTWPWLPCFWVPTSFLPCALFCKLPRCERMRGLIAWPWPLLSESDPSTWRQPADRGAQSLQLALVTEPCVQLGLQLQAALRLFDRPFNFFSDWEEDEPSVNSEHTSSVHPHMSRSSSCAWAGPAGCCCQPRAPMGLVGQLGRSGSCVGTHKRRQNLQTKFLLDSVLSAASVRCSMHASTRRSQIAITCRETCTAKIVWANGFHQRGSEALTGAEFHIHF